MYLGWDVGIKNLAFCLLDYKDKKIELIDWGIINLLVHKSPPIYCNCLKKNGETCGRRASFYCIPKDNKENEHYCNIHLKTYKKEWLKSLSEKDRLEKESQIKTWSDKWVCCKDGCSKIATRYCIKNHLYYCTKHSKETDTIKDAINQSSAIRMPMLTLGKILYNKLDKHPQLLKAKWICIENQPVLKNPTMKSIQMMLYSYFVMKQYEGKLELHDMILMSAKNKLKVYKDKYGELPKKILSMRDKYRRNKMMAIEHTRLFIENEHDEEWQEFYNEHDKKDDLADAYLMTRYFIEK
tara:strand:+ start:289 stop:1176 length:888 start_codon:yes stop_codon:yes gene_type:complete